MLCKIIFIFFISFAELVFGDECEEPFVKVGTKCLWKTLTPVTRNENLQICRDLGATLASPRTAEENKLVKQFVGGEWFWLSGHRFVKGQKRYIWMDGEEFAYSDWNSIGYPRFMDHQGEVCILLHGTHGMDDYPCDTKYMQLCEKEIETEIKCDVDEIKKNEHDKIEKDMQALKNVIQNQEIEMKKVKDELAKSVNKLVIINNKGSLE